MNQLFFFAVLSIFTTAFSSPAPQFWNRPVIDREANLQVQIRINAVLENLITQYDESINFQPGLNLYQVAGALTDLFGTKGSQLCAPIAITHGFTYLKYPAQYTNLKTISDLDNDGKTDTYSDKIRYFFNSCNTDKEEGTRYRQAIACMKQYILDSGYNAYAYMVGPHAIEAPEGYPLATMQHVLGVDDIRSYVGHRMMVVMGIGWYSYDSASGKYTRQGGHFINVYGYDYLNAWGDSQIILKVVNNWVDYSPRNTDQMFDAITMKKVLSNGTQYPAEIAFELSGTGFDFAQKAFVEDIFVALPLQ